MSKDNNLPSEEKKKILPQRKNRGAKMGDLERDLETMLYNEQHQWLFLEESSDDDFDPCHKSIDEDDNDNKENEDSEWDEEDNEENGGDNGEEEEDNNKKKRRNIQKFLLNKKRGPTPETDEIYDLNQLDIDKIDKYEDDRIIKKRKKPKKIKIKRKAKSNNEPSDVISDDKIINNITKENNKTDASQTPKKRPLFLINTQTNKNNNE